VRLDPDQPVPARILAHQSVEHIDRQRILSDECRFDRLDLLLHAHPGTAIGLADTVEAVFGDDLHQRVAARSLQDHHFDVAYLLTSLFSFAQDLELFVHRYLPMNM